MHTYARQTRDSMHRSYVDHAAIEWLSLYVKGSRSFASNKVMTSGNRPLMMKGGWPVGLKNCRTTQTEVWRWMQKGNLLMLDQAHAENILLPALTNWLKVTHEKRETDATKLMHEKIKLRNRNNCEHRIQHFVQTSVRTYARQNETVCNAQMLITRP